MELQKNCVKLINRFTCFVVFGILNLSRNLVIFDFSGDIFSALMLFSRNFIVSVSISHFSGDSFSPD